MSLDKSVDKNEWQGFLLAFEQVHQDFFSALKSECDSLTPNDLRLCALLRMNMSSKEIATMLGISADSVRVARHRVRKKLDIPHEEKLIDHLIKI